MPGHPLGRAIRRLLRRVATPPGASISDAELLERFVRQGDQAAIETLLWRHGPMVLRTCRRLMGALHDAEDCFQATFLVLCRKASTITRRQSLGSWLHKVASRICLRARAMRRRQPGAIPADVEPSVAEAASPLAWQEVRMVVDEELNRLPEKYRAPLVLHYLEGKSVEQTATELGWPQGTVCARLSRGKERLRSQLVRRGVTLSTGALSAALAHEVATAALPESLAYVTVQALTNGTPSRLALVLARNFLRAEFSRRVKWVSALLLAMGTAAGAGVVLSHNQPQLPPNPGARPSDKGEATSRQAGLDPDRDPLPEGALLRFGNARFRLAPHAVAAAYAPDGRTFTTVGIQGLVHTWDAATGRPLRAFHVPAMMPVALSADGKIAAVYEPETVSPRPIGGRVRLRFVSGGEDKQLIVPPEADVRALAISADGKRVAAGGGSDSLLVWNVGSGKLIRQLPAPGWSVIGSQVQVGLSPNGKLLAAYDSHPTIRLWDVETSEERRPLLIEGSQFSVFAFSGDGRVLACGDLAGQISLWDLLSGRLTRCFSARPPAASAKGVEPSTRSNGVASGGGSQPKADKPRRGFDGVSSLAISSDGKLIACCCDRVVSTWDAAGKALAQIAQASVVGGPALPLAFSPDNQFLVGGDDTSQIKVWRVANGRSILADNDVDLDREKIFGCLAAVSPDDSRIATVSARIIRLWDVRTGRQLGEILPGNVEDRKSRRITFSADGKFLLRGHYAIPVTDVLSGKANGDMAWTVYPWARPPRDKNILFRYYSELLSDHRIVRRLATDPAPVWPWHQKFRPFALSPDEKTVACGAGTEAVLIFCDWNTAKEISRAPCPAPLRSASFAPDGRSLAAAGESYVGMWDVNSGRQIRELAKASNDPNAEQAQIERPLAFSPDGRFLAAGDADCNICIWNAATGNTASVLKGHSGPILSLAFFADGRRLISGSADSTALIWDVSSLVKEHDP